MVSGTVAPTGRRHAASALGAELELSRAAALPDATAKPSARAQETRTAIMTAARESFVKNGISATRLAAIARAAWVAPSTVSLHFKGKEALFAACLDEDIEQLFDGAYAAVAGHPYPHLSGDLVRALAALLPEHPLLSTVLAHSPGTWGDRFYRSADLGNAIARLCAEIGRAQGDGLVRDDIDPAVLGRSLGAVVAGTLWPVFLQHGADHDLTEQALVVIQASLFAPIDDAARLDEIVRPWREAHGDLQVRYDLSALGALGTAGARARTEHPRPLS